ncbi:HAMP domain-containing sensor histidine kinase [Knoellia sp. S7-12]|uniref:sensor histidine kinase n=1 Tax=Knoellia sp. S7-12 TaxID=3126698 RepID=UPI0033695062
MSAVLVSAGVTAAVAAVGSTVLSAVSARRPAHAVLGAPLVIVISLAAGVAAASRAMLLAEDDYRTVLFVLMAGAPVALIIGILQANRLRTFERVAAEEAARRDRNAAVEVSRRETIQWLSHDLRTPLTGIRLLAEALQDSSVESPDKAIRIINEVDRMAGMVDDITELSRRGGTVTDDPQLVSVDDLVSEAVAAIAPIAESSGVAVEAGERTLVDVRVDADRVVRALANVVRNAVQHTPAGEAVVVSSSHSAGGVVRVSVTDACGGLTDEDLARVFEPGWRGDGARTERGMGLGATIVRDVARAHGGDVSVVNRPDATGCVVTVTLPAVDRA